MILQYETSIDMNSLMLIMTPFIIIGIAMFVVWLIALIDCLKNENMGDDKLLWALVIVITGVIGAILWYVIGKPKYKKYPPRPY